jgi:hypothetical protein
MSVNTLIQEDLVGFRHDLILYFKEQHPHIFPLLKSVLSGHKIMVGLRVIEEGTLVEKYTFLMEGIDVFEIKSGELDSAIHHPLVNVVKPYVTMERSAIETMVKDEQFKTKIVTSIAKYLPDITVGFMR